MEKLLNRKFLVISFLFLFAGCGYQLIKNQSTKNFFISNFENLTLQPQLQIYLTDNLEEKILSYPYFKLTKNKGKADIIVDGAIKKFEREPLFFSSGDSSNIIIAKFIVSVDLKLTKGEEQIFQTTLNENLSISLSQNYKEEEMMRKITDLISQKIFSIILKKYEEGKI